MYGNHRWLAQANLGPARLAGQFLAGPPHKSLLPHYILPHRRAQVKPSQLLNFCYEIVTTLLQRCYRSVTTLLHKCYGTESAPEPYPIRRQATSVGPLAHKLRAGSWKKLEAGSCPEKSTEQLEAGNSIRAGSWKNQLHRFSACGELRYSAHILEHKDPPQAGFPSA